MVLKKNNYKKNLYLSLLNIFLKCGKKNSIKKIFDSVLLNSSHNLRISPILLILKIYFRLDNILEIKEVRIKRRKYRIPFSSNYNRRIYLSSKQIKQSIDVDKRKISLSVKLSQELINIILVKNSRAIKAKKSNLLLVKNSRSNIHFRWR